MKLLDIFFLIPFILGALFCVFTFGWVNYEVIFQRDDVVEKLFVLLFDWMMVGCFYMLWRDR
jgi:hypothetical protein